MDRPSVERESARQGHITRERLLGRGCQGWSPFEDPVCTRVRSCPYLALLHRTRVAAIAASHAQEDGGNNQPQPHEPPGGLTTSSGVRAHQNLRHALPPEAHQPCACVPAKWAESALRTRRDPDRRTLSLLRKGQPSSHDQTSSALNMRSQIPTLTCC